MDNPAEIYYKRGIKYFELEQYEQAVSDLIQAYDLGYEQEWILENIYQCFIVPNEQEFRRNYEQNSNGFTQLPFEECILDFIPVYEDRYYIFNREEKKFQGMFALEEAPVQGKTFIQSNILYTDVWDIREILPEMKENFRSAVYILLEGLEPKFASFLKLANFPELYLRNVLVFKNEMILRAYLEQCERSNLPQEIIADNAEKYSKILFEVHQRRVHNLAVNQIKAAEWFIAENGNQLKRQISEAIRKGEDAEELKCLIKEYETKYPMDLDLYAIKAWYEFTVGETESAYNIIQKALRKNPYYFAANRIARILCVESGRYAEAVKYDSILTMLKGAFSELPAVEAWKDALMELFEAQYHVFLAQGDESYAVKYWEGVEYLKRQSKVSFGLNDHAYGLGTLSHLIGKIYENAFGKKFTAFYADNPLAVLRPDEPELWDNWLTTKLECLDFLWTDRFSLSGEGEYLLPILSPKAKRTFKFTMPDNREITCSSKQSYRFEYYRLPPATLFTSETPLCLGNPIPIKQDPEKKKLVLNIFVDGISQKVIEEEDFAEIMPFTNAFFSKGVRCTNAYAASEWTLPSVATYVTGASTVNHMLIQKDITNTLPDDITVLAEYFKEQGYQTAKIDGDWRSNLSYGYGRGVDRIIYQHQSYGMRAEHVVADVLEHMELMKETNQFIWMCAGDLHDVADGYALKPSVNVSIPLENLAAEDAGETSVKQTYSENKRAAYIKQLKYIDRHLEIIYRYIEENYKDDEIVVSLFGDHGQGYLVGDEEHFLSAGRTKVGMMFRGGGYQGAECQEIISACDYLPIICKLAGIPLKDEKIDGILPAFFGGKSEREYAITESIHPGDPYQVAIVSKEHVFYLIAEGQVQYDGRFELGKYQCKLMDKMGKECLEPEHIDYYFNILMQHIGSLLIY